MTTQNKLSQHTSWLFAFGSIAAGIAVSYALAGLGQKVTAAVYFAIVALGGFGATYLTRARVGGAILTFFVAAAVAGGAYYLLVEELFSAASSKLSDVGRTMGIFVAAIVFLETLVAGIAGSVAGVAARGKTGFAAIGHAARAVQ
jgi:hypothetical protein